MGRRRSGGILGTFPGDALDPRHPIRVGAVYELPMITQIVVGIELFDPCAPGWSGMGHDGRSVGIIVPGDTFIAVERVEHGSGSSEEVWIVLCKGILGKCILGDWELATVREVSTGAEP